MNGIVLFISFHFSYPSPHRWIVVLLCFLLICENSIKVSDKELQLKIFLETKVFILFQKMKILKFMAMAVVLLGFCVILSGYKTVCKAELNNCLSKDIKLDRLRLVCIYVSMYLCIYVSMKIY